MATTVLFCVFSHDVMVAISVSQNGNETAAMFVSQTSPVGVELFSYVNAFFCSKICIDASHVNENTEYNPVCRGVTACTK